ncbi:Protein of unknown function [Gryllus bimaculatus]|nr:Protein of unknown function [Gryllus bimaculatus]
MEESSPVVVWSSIGLVFALYLGFVVKESPNSCVQITNLHFLVYSIWHLNMMHTVVFCTVYLHFPESGLLKGGKGLLFKGSHGEIRRPYTIVRERAPGNEQLRSTFQNKTSKGKFRLARKSAV